MLRHCPLDVHPPLQAFLRHCGRLDARNANIVSVDYTSRAALLEAAPRSLKAPEASRSMPRCVVFDARHSRVVVSTHRQQLLVYLGVPFILLLLPALPDRPMLVLLPLLLSIMPGSRELLLPVLREAARLVQQSLQRRQAPEPPEAPTLPRSTRTPLQQRPPTPRAAPPKNNVSELPCRVRQPQRLVRLASWDRVGVDIPISNHATSSHTPRDALQ